MVVWFKVQMVLLVVSEDNFMTLVFGLGYLKF